VIAASDAIVWRFNILALESALYPKENRHDAGLA
jgi:hypothetical protein